MTVTVTVTDGDGDGLVLVGCGWLGEVAIDDARSRIVEKVSAGKKDRTLLLMLTWI